MVKKKDKKMIIGIFIFIIVIILDSTFGGLFSVTGSNTLSISTGDFKSSNPYFSGDAYILTFTAGSLGQSYYGRTLSESIIEDETGTRPLKDFEIEVDYKNQQCIADIDVDYNRAKIYKIDVCEWKDIPFQGGDQYYQDKINDKCGIDGSAQIGLPNGLGQFFTYYAYYKTEEYTIGRTEEFNKRIQADIKVDIDGDKEVLSIDSTGTTQGKLGDLGYAIWSGNLNRGYSCKYSSDQPFVPIYYGSGNNKNWILISEAKYDQYLVDKNIDYSGLLELEYKDKEYNLNLNSNRESFKEDWNNNINSVTQMFNYGSIDSKNTFNNAQIVSEVEQFMESPLITIYLKAEELGVYTPNPKIQILKGDSECFKSGEDGQISVKVKNIGDETGNWEYYADCDGNFISNDNNIVSLKENQIKTVYIDIFGDSDTRIEDECKVIFERAGDKQTINVDVCVDPQQICTPNSVYCKDGNVVQCNEDGSGSIIIEECESDEYCDSSSKSCKKTNETSETPVNGDFNKPLFGFTFVIALISAIVGYIYMKPIEVNKFTEYLRSIISIVVFIFVFLLVPYLYYLIIGLFV